ncbi:uncharacterized protein LOC128754491 [Synchiropus splendidus]|uniref:uncharacterized protein LOC128754491 n=1 Tax=Synchiropus splendidus TaxID=270530 RepID=UPI00237EE070|nr:uncharacterized protein LOC128754491 [Synchiropus splendidus]
MHHYVFGFFFQNHVCFFTSSHHFFQDFTSSETNVSDIKQPYLYDESQLPHSGAVLTESTESLVELEGLTADVNSPLEAEDPLESSELEEHSKISPLNAPPTDVPGQDATDEKCTLSSESSPTPSVSGSPQLDKLICDLEEMKGMLTCSEEPESRNEATAILFDNDLADFECLTEEKSQRPSTPFSLEEEEEETEQTTASAADQIKYKELLDTSAVANDIECPLMSGSSEGHDFGSDRCVPSVEESSSKETCLPAMFHENQPDTDATSLPEESSEVISLNDSRGDIQEDDSTSSFSDLVDIHKEESTAQEPGEGAPLHDEASLDMNQSWDLLQETASPAEYFTFEEIVPDMSLFDKQPDFGHLHSESVDSADYHVTPLESKAQTLSASDDDYSSPPAQQNLVPPEYSEVVQSGAHSSAVVGNDPELFFDCTHGAAASEEAAGSVEECPKQGKRAAVLSSGSDEDYEDASFSHEEHGKLKQWDDSDEEFIMCEAAIARMGEYEDIGEALAREVSAELGPMSESSDDEFLTTRIVRRRVVIKVSDSNGHDRREIGARL